MSEHQLKQRIIEMSDANNWERAVLEWKLQGVYMDKKTTCLCGHYPIVNICEIRNYLNNNTAIVGNCCVNNFLGLHSKKIFGAIKRVHMDIDKSFNTETIEFAFYKKWVNEWEKEFYLDIKNKRNLSDKQLKCKRKINKKILNRFNRVSSSHRQV